MNGITEIADSINSELKRRLPKQRKTQRTKLALLVSTMLDVRSANLMDLAAGLPRDVDRTDMRYQWIARLLGNPLVGLPSDWGCGGGWGMTGRVFGWLGNKNGMGFAPGGNRGRGFGPKRRRDDDRAPR